MPKKRLVVDDDTDNRLVLVKVLSGDGYDVVEAVDGEDTVARAHHAQSVILMDLALPYARSVL